MWNSNISDMTPLANMTQFKALMVGVKIKLLTLPRWEI